MGEEISPRAIALAAGKALARGMRSLIDGNSCSAAFADKRVSFGPVPARYRHSYAAEPRHALLATVRAGCFLDDLIAGDGGELKSSRGAPPKFLAAHSSAGLAVNCFAPWRDAPGRLKVMGRTGLTVRGFEQKFANGVSSRLPNLDVVLDGPGGVIAVESKCTEYLSPKVRKSRADIFPPKYDRRRKELAPGWRTAMDKAHTYRHLDAGQLVKHYCGLSWPANDGLGDGVTLLYLYWEPQDAERWAVFGNHRQEIARFGETVNALTGSGVGRDVAFAAMSYDELWREWDRMKNAPDWLRRHLSLLLLRYRVTIGEHLQER